MTDSESPIFQSPSEDAEMEQAAAKARQTFRFFWREMAWEQRRIVPGLDLAAVKGSFSDPPEIRAENRGGFEVEHMWLLEVMTPFALAKCLGWKRVMERLQQAGASSSL